MPAPTSDLGAGAADGSGSGPEPYPALTAAVEVARAAAQEEAAAGGDPVGPALALGPPGDEPVGPYSGHEVEGLAAVTHYFDSNYPGYVGWRWAVTVSSAGPDDPVTVSEVVLLPGSDALTAPKWLPWSERVLPGDLSAGDLLPSSPHDHRLAPGHLTSDDSAPEELARPDEFGRSRVMSKQGRLEAAQRWYEGDFGPNSEMARLAPGSCGTCGFLLYLGGSMSAAFGVCGNGVSPADGRVVHVEFGCGAHSEAEVDTSSTVPVAEVVYDNTTLDFESRTEDG